MPFLPESSIVTTVLSRGPTFISSLIELDQAGKELPIKAINKAWLVDGRLLLRKFLKSLTFT
jgi:hypothetical protein